MFLKFPQNTMNVLEDQIPTVRGDILFRKMLGKFESKIKLKGKSFFIFYFTLPLLYNRIFFHALWPVRLNIYFELILT